MSIFLPISLAKKSSTALLLPISKCNLHQGQRIRIILLLLFELVQVPVRATFGEGKLSAHGGPSMVNATAARFGIDELASLSKQRILLTSQHSFLLINLRVTVCRDFYSDAEVFGEPTNITWLYLNSLVYRAAVGGTVNTIIIGLLLSIRGNITHDRKCSPLSYRRLDF